MRPRLKLYNPSRRRWFDIRMAPHASDSLHSHLWSDGALPHRIEQEGKTILHQRCIHCGRDFAREMYDDRWRAAHVGLLEIVFLADSVNDIWLTEKCPGQLVEEDVPRRKLIKSKKTL
jgi:hypothetical protein